MTDTLAPRALIGVMTPAMNTVVQPELELLRPLGVTNQMQRFRLGGDSISDDLFAEAEKLMDCNPRAIAIGLTTDAGPGGVAKLAAPEVPLENVVTELWVAAYARTPSQAEQEKMLAFLTANEDRRVAVEDIFWSVLNSKEFIFNH